jgi:tRNA 2-thiocytidine biosynthesis protein TtcA
MLRDWEEKFPGRVESIFSSICNASASQLADPALFDFAGLETVRAAALAAGTAPGTPGMVEGASLALDDIEPALAR